MRLTLEIDLDNAAFEQADQEVGPAKLDRLALLEALGAAAGKIGAGHDEGPILDFNGNTVGRFAITEPESHEVVDMAGRHVRTVTSRSFPS